MAKLSTSEEHLRNMKFQEGLVWCSLHKAFLPVTEFGQERGKKRRLLNYGYRSVCLTCDVASHLIKPDYLPRQRQRKQVNKAKYVAFAGGCCQRCGFDEFQSALQFHHVYPATKTLDPRYLIQSKDLKKCIYELDRCCLLCANCHTAYEGGEWRAEFLRRGPELMGWTVGEPLPLTDNRYLNGDQLPTYSWEFALFLYAKFVPFYQQDLITI